MRQPIKRLFSVLGHVAWHFIGGRSYDTTSLLTIDKPGGLSDPRLIKSIEEKFETDTFRFIFSPTNMKQNELLEPNCSIGEAVKLDDVLYALCLGGYSNGSAPFERVTIMPTFFYFRKGWEIKGTSEQKYEGGPVQKSFAVYVAPLDNS